MVGIDAIDLASLGEMPNEIPLASASNWPPMGRQSKHLKGWFGLLRLWVGG